MRRIALLLICVAASAGCGGPQKTNPEPTGAQADKPLTPFAEGEAAIGAEAWQEALGHFDAVLEKEPNHEQALYYRAVALEKLGRLDEATAGYQKVIEIDPKMVAARINLAAIHLEAKPPRTKEAIAVLEPAASMDPKAYDVRENLAYAYRVEGDAAKAEAYYREALSIAEHPRIHFALADVLFEAGKVEESAEHYQKAWPGFVDDLDTLLVIAHRLGKTKKYADCVEAFSAAIKLKDSEPGFFLHRGLCQHGLKKLADERADYEAALAIDDKFAPGWYYLGMSYLDDDPKKAKDALTKAVEHGGDSPVGKRAKQQLAKLK